MRSLVLLLLLMAVTTEAKKIRIGVALRPYYSFVSKVVGDSAEVVPMVDGANPHGYSVTPADVKRALTLDAVVLNGIGHDDFAEKILSSAGIKGSIHTIFANDDVALIPESVGSKALNSHTFVSISTSIMQVYSIANGLAEIAPEQGDYFKKNAAAFARELRMLKMDYMDSILTYSDRDIKCATTHGGYSYLLQEFGITVDEVIEPAHGMNPSAAQLKQLIERIKREGIEVIFSEKDYPGSFTKVLAEETNVKIVPLSHLSAGKFAVDTFEKGMQYNLDQLLIAVKGVESE